MGLFAVAWSADEATFDVAGVQARDAAEMESRLQSLVDSSATPQTIADVVLAGVGQGPGWQAALVLDAAGAPASLQRSTVRVAAAEGGSRAQAYSQLLTRLRTLYTEAAFTVVGKVEIDGNGFGSKFMAVALAGDAPA